MHAKLVSIQVGKPKKSAGRNGNIFESGIFKNKIDEPVYAKRLNLVGDAQSDLKNHGGIDKAVNVYPSEHYRYFMEEYSLELSGGAFGENFTTEGLIENTVYIGDIFQIGGAVFQVSQPRQPCWKLSARWMEKLDRIFVQSGKTGWYFRVLDEGTVQQNSPIKLVERKSDWSIQKINYTFYHSHNRDELNLLAECPYISESWQISIKKKADKIRA